MKNRYLVLKGKAGLGNRLLLLGDAISRAKAFDRRLIVDWNDPYYSSSPQKNAFPCFLRLVDLELGPESSWLIPDQDSLSFYPAPWQGNLDKSQNQVIHKGKWTIEGPFFGDPAKTKLTKTVPA